MRKILNWFFWWRCDCCGEFQDFDAIRFRTPVMGGVDTYCLECSQEG